ncbi:two-component regulator propeller domain-containing protein [Flavivirga spongiicola]|uniref:histidine kinase n=1 Tax=Flavivirga spongiicola TaxID=421621 RepID=A0ABU7XXS1_9FLAO|nr:two-component regulator propeller domain-containing protein [Flavivirga sp. MEBiC05379]MDO5980195.1 two-component regulator propeller domain-containing protein [Flavivirga sp. MEBiC05379]
MLKVLKYVLFYLLSISVYSQNSDIKFDYIDDNNGLSSNSVLSISQDSLGFMWFATRYGLNRYDGYEVKTYYRNTEDENSISNNHINKVFKDSNHNLWVATKSGVNRYNKNFDSFTRLEIKNNALDFTNDYFIDIIEDSNKSIWLLSLASLVKCRTFDIKNANPKLESYHDLSTIKPKCLYVDKENTIWIGAEEGLFIIKNKRLSPYKLINTKHTETIISINKIYELDNGELALATENAGLQVLNIKSQRIINYLRNDNNNENSLVNDRVRSIFESKKGDIWLGTRDGLSVLNHEKNRVTNFLHKSIDQNSISDNSIKDIFEDNAGGIWLATYAGGVNYYHPENSKFKHIKRDFINSNSLSSDKISFLYKDKGGVLWIGTEGSGINRYNEGNGVIKSYSNFPDHYEALDNIKAIAESNNQYLWLGTNGGLSKFDKETHTFTNFTNNPLDPNSLSYDQIHSILHDSGILWIGTNGGGLNKFDISKNTFQVFKSNDSESGIISDNINHLLQEKNGGLWIGTEAGIDFLLPDKLNFNRSDAFKQLQRKLNPSINNVLFSDDHNYLWIGTEGDGLISINKDKHSIQFYTRADGLPGNIVYAIEQDKKSNIWISTNKGLSKLTLNYLKDSIELVKVNNFNKKDGLQGNLFSYRSSFKDRFGMMYFGGVKGYNTFYPSQILDTSSRPSVIFTDFKINYETIKPGDKKSPLVTDITKASNITLKYDQQPFSFTYAGLQFINPNNLYYSYQLEGIDDDWVIAGKERTLTYTRLHEGSYELRIKASDNLNQWGDDYTKIAITILPPPWRSWWAYLLYVFVSILALIFAIYYTNKWFQLKNILALEKLSKEKEHELHERKVKFFTDVSHELRTPLTLILTPLEKLMDETKNNLKFNKKIRIIQNNSRKMLLLINQLLDLRKFETGHVKLEIAEGNISKFIKETTLPFREMAKIKGMDFSYKPSKPHISFCFDRVKMEIIIYNLLSNAFKAISSHGSVEVRLEELSKKDELGDVRPFVKIEVEDNGKGIPEKYTKSIFDRFYQSENDTQLGVNSSGIGLELTKRMVKLHQGTITVFSKMPTDTTAGKTIFTIEIPQGNIDLESKPIKREHAKGNEQSLYKTELLKSELYDYQVESESRKFDEILSLGKDTPALLVVEDNKSISNLICDLFKDDFKVRTAYNGKEGWNKILENIPDIVISDIMMPEMDGLELCRMLKTDKRTCHIPVILLTARTSVTFKYEGMETGADDYVKKPFSTKYLSMRVKSLLHQRKLVQEHLFRNSVIQPKELGLNSTDEVLLTKAVKYIEENLDNPELSVENLSNHLGLSRVHFYRKIKSIANVTAVDFIKNVRLKKAIQLLESDSYSIKEVRYLTGFNDATYFRTSFKKLFGVNPSQYIKESKSGNK